MKLLHLIAQKPGETGSGTYLRNIVKVAKSKGYSQCVVAGIDEQDQEYLKVFPEDVLFYPVLFNTRELPFPVPGMSDVMPYPSTKHSEMTEEMFFRWQKAFKTVLKQVSSFEPDYIIVHHLWLLAALSRKIFPQTPLIGICHSTEFRQLVSAKHLKKYVLPGCKELDGVAALSLEQKNTIHRIYGIAEDRVRVVGGGFANELFYPPKKKPEQGKIKILYAGKISQAKGIRSLLRVFSKLPVPADKIELTLIGSGFGAEYGEIMDMLKGKSNVHYMGPVFQTALSKVMRESHIFVLPSFYEGFSLVAVEALASGLRLVVNELPALREWIGTELEEKGLVKFVKMPKLQGIDLPVPSELPAYEDRLREGILQQINRVKSSETVPLLGWQEMVHKYSWQAVFGKIENIYNNIPSYKKL